MERSDGLVVAQAAALTGVLWPGRARWELPVPVTVAASSLIVVGGVLALAGAAPHTRLTPRVRPPAGARLVTTGAYAVTRNPIYVGLAAGAWGLALLRRRPGPLLSAAALTGVLAAKSTLEESALADAFGRPYLEYAARTPRFVGRPRR
ncbi:methyltransferase family protein [Georgenia sp. SUBG003]|uniref:methyltransferase family protein n=1 Tax=Georgenia sp. SUBG003 TaxID=1497974 RepID=UPI000693A3A7